ncbi:MAG: DUF58 domain-containing protein [Gammaproteobacteria bacterium]|nr:DUF58 domain-containing protein [Gammaproteobacteria bacterium]
MDDRADNVPGIDIRVDDLVRVRGQLSGLALVTSQRRARYRSGAREVRVRGRGMEYEESRAYVYGDDVRTMDWRVMARTGEAHTKIFAEEKERRFLVAVDLSASMFFGTRFSFKSWAAAQVAAHAGWLASFAGDRIGGLIVSPAAHHEVRPGKTRAGLLGVFHHLAGMSRIDSPPDMTRNRLNFLLGELNRVVKPGSIIALITDFIGLDEQSLEILSSIVKHNDVSAYWIHDDTEIKPWPGGHYQVLVNQQKVGFDISGSASDAWLSQWQQEHRNRIETLASRFDIPLLPVSCNHAITPQFLSRLSI